MKVLFIPGNSPQPIFSHAPLVNAMRVAGHQVLVGGINWVLPTIASVGLPAVQITPLSEQEVSAFIESMPTDPESWAHSVGKVYAEIALSSLPNLLELAEDWRPDVVVGGGMFYTAPLLAHHLGIPCVRVEWDRNDTRPYDPGAEPVLRPVLDELGLAALPGPDLWLDVCPPSLRPAEDAARQSMRWIPLNAQKPLQPWMYSRPDRPRVYLTRGARMPDVADLRETAKHLLELDVEVVVGTSEQVAEPLRAELPEVRAGFVPLDVLAPTCDLMVHHGGGGTDMNALHAGVPQLIVDPEYPAVAISALVDFGAGLLVDDASATPRNVLDAAKELLGDPTYRTRAQALSAEIAEMPTPARVVPQLEELKAQRKSG
ncbi:nucleotide disphospho-sugar-binding domain-containing protein [Kibdelosporangium aridum]|uniref:nucleotide disphospho-sugar-binding domain-containing protein n=1 Tax=Kibdelosporangium aridum TaxID=2030 RepID=UPI0005263729